MKGNLITYNDYRKWGIFNKHQYMQKWMRLIKWNNGFWKAVIIIGEEYAGNSNLQIVEVVNNGGIFTLPKTEIHPYKKGWADTKKWK